MANLREFIKKEDKTNFLDRTHWNLVSDCVLIYANSKKDKLLGKMSPAKALEFMENLPESVNPAEVTVQIIKTIDKEYLAEYIKQQEESIEEFPHTIYFYDSITGKEIHKIQTHSGAK